MSRTISGMAASIRSVSESETFDLAGQNVTTISKTIHDAFEEPLPLTTTMVRVTFVTGAGKLGRQKYDDGAAKAVTSTLRDIGFEEDRGASCVVECAGTYKLQHDTGKNLKTVVVFPKILVSTSSSGDGDEADTTTSTDNNNNNKSFFILEEGKPESLIALSSDEVFDRMISSKCPSWSQKKECTTKIEYLKSLVQGLDDNLMKGIPLNDAEQEFYDSVSSDKLESKEKFVKSKMQAQVESGRITRTEREFLLNQVSERLEKIHLDMDESSSSKKPKKLEKLKGIKDKLEQRQSLLKNITPVNPNRLKHENEIHKLLLELVPLQKLEDKASGGKLMSIKETQMMGRKQEIESKILELEEASRGWFETDDAFEIRLQLTQDAFNAKQKQTKGKSTTNKTTVKTTIPKWVTPGQSRVGKSSKTTKKKKQQGGAGGVFAAMMMDSDSE